MKLREMLAGMLLVGILLPAAGQRDKEDLNLFSEWVQWSNSENMLQLYINDQAFDQLDQREQEVAELKTKEDWLERQKKDRKALEEIVGPFPEKTPLNARVVDVVQKDGYRIEKIIYESMPGLLVTGAMFIPDGVVEKRPTILNVLGHSAQAFRRDSYQMIIHNLVKKGFVVFAIDPISQGERVQYYDPEKKKSSVGIAIFEHSYVGNQCLLNGYSVAKYFMWDAIRALDYLETREEVDPTRFGLTGTSGGGTITSYVGAIDDRIKAAAPSCYITSYRRLLQSIGTQDGEQFLYHSIVKGIDHAALIELRAPKPTLLLAQSRDFFSIQGTHETYEELKTAYAALGAPEHINLVEDDFLHSQTEKTKEAIYGFFQKELGMPGDSDEENLEVLPEKELDITSTGMLSTSDYESKLVFDVNKPESEELLEDLAKSRKRDSKHLAEVIARAKELSGYEYSDQLDEVIYRGRYIRDGYFVEKYALNVQGLYAVPILVMVPEGTAKKKPAIIYLHPEGKHTDASVGGKMEQLVKQGNIVVAPDPLGIGETESKRRYPGGQSYNAQLIGRSIVGIQASDISRVVNFAKQDERIDPSRISALAFDTMSPALLHAGAFDQSIKEITLVNPLISYGEIATNKMYAYDVSFHWGVAGALTSYDLPDLAASLSPRKLTILEPYNYQREPATSDLIKEEYEYVKSVYKKNKAMDKLKIEIREPEDITNFYNQ